MIIAEHKKYASDFDQILNEQRDVMRFAVCGRFKSGKTSLLNLLLGLDLPVKVTTATGIVTKIKYGVKDTIQLSDGTYRQVSKEELNKYIAIKGKTLDGVKIGEAVTAFTGSKSDLMQKGEVEFWDTPGLEDDYRLTEITLNAVEQCDAVIFVLDATKFLSQTEKMLLNGKLQERVGNNIIIAVNRLDMLNEDGRQQIYHESESLKGLGNHICGYDPVFTCAASDYQNIDDLLHRVSNICSNSRQRKTCIDSARKARIHTFAEKWLELLRSDYEQVTQEKIKLEREQEEFISSHQKKLEDSYRKDKVALIRSIQTASFALDSTSEWTNTLQKMHSVQNWEYNYVALSQEAMTSGLRDIFNSIMYAAESSVSKIEYSECFPFPEISRARVWDRMNWGSNFSANNSGGMLTGAVTGAIAGSVIPFIGTFFGAAAGFILGAGHDASQDEAEKSAFQKRCITNTISAFQNGPAGIAKQEIQRFQDTVLRRMETVFTRKKGLISAPYEMKNAYDEVCGHKQQLEFYMSVVSRSLS